MEGWFTILLECVCECMSEVRYGMIWYSIRYTVDRYLAYGMMEWNGAGFHQIFFFFRDMRPFDVSFSWVERSLERREEEEEEEGCMFI